MQINKSKILDFIILTLLILYTASSSTLSENDSFAIGTFVFLLILFFARKCKPDKIVFKLLTIWLIINILSAYIANPNISFSTTTLYGVTLRMIMPYLMLKIVGPNILEKLIKYLYVLSGISIIIFLFQFFIPQTFYSLSPYLNGITQQEQTENGGWYIFIYMFSGWASNRNCGFMWEPGAFAAILIISIIYRFITNNFKIDKMVVIFIIALITTFSTAGYIAFIFILLAFYINNKKSIFNPIYILSFVFLIYFIPKFYTETDFMETKIKGYIEQGTESGEHSSGTIRVSRLGIALVAIDHSLHWPFGNGILESEYKIEKYKNVQGSNSLATILTQWGWIGLMMLFVTLYKFCNFSLKSPFISIFCVISIGVVLFSNPFSFKYIIYFLFFYTSIYLTKSKRISYNE